MNRHSRPVWLTALALTALVAGACGQSPGAVAAAHPPTGPRTVFVALGGGESAGSQVSEPDYEDWAQLFYRQALSARSTFYDFSGSGGTTVSDLLEGELSQALAVRPDLVTVFVGLPDLLDGTLVSQFESGLEQVLGRLKASHAEVLVADLLPVDRFPAYPRCVSRPSACGLFSTVFYVPPQSEMAADIASYDQAISAAAASDGDRIVDLSAAFSARIAAGGSTAIADTSDLGLTPAGETLVAQTFVSAFGKAER